MIYQYCITDKDSTLKYLSIINHDIQCIYDIYIGIYTKYLILNNY